MHTQWTAMILIWNLKLEAFESNFHQMLLVRELGKTTALVSNLIPDCGSGTVGLSISEGLGLWV